jgi:hypothetical protein
MLIVPYTSTLDCASAMHGAAKAPATAMVRSFFCMLTPLWFKPGAKPIGPHANPSIEKSKAVCRIDHCATKKGSPLRREFALGRCKFPTTIVATQQRD